MYELNTSLASTEGLPKLPTIGEDTGGAKFLTSAQREAQCVLLQDYLNHIGILPMIIAQEVFSFFRFLHLRLFN